MPIGFWPSIMYRNFSSNSSFFFHSRFSIILATNLLIIASCNTIGISSLVLYFCMFFKLIVSHFILSQLIFLCTMFEYIWLILSSLSDKYDQVSVSTCSLFQLHSCSDQTLRRNSFSLIHSIFLVLFTEFSAIVFSLDKINNNYTPKNIFFKV